MKPIKIRGHHLIGLSDYLKGGEIIHNPKYGFLNYLNKKRVLNKIIKNPNQKVQITDSMDNICKFCKAKNKEEKKKECGYAPIDKNYAEMMDLNMNKTYNANTILDKIRFSEKEGDLKDFKKFRTDYVIGKIKINNP